jgi:undecaprenyl-diphosphatase
MDIELKLIKDLQKYNIINENFTSFIMNLVSLPFHFKFFIVIIFIIYLMGYLTQKQLLIIFLGQLIIITIKYFIQRRRPYQVDNKIKMMETMSFDPYSFPSGHTFNACLVAFLLKNYIDLSIIPYLVGFSRIYMGVHYPSDIIGGIILSKIILNISTKF